MQSQVQHIGSIKSFAERTPARQEARAMRESWSQVVEGGGAPGHFRADIDWGCAMDGVLILRLALRLLASLCSVDRLRNAPMSFLK